MKPDATFLGSSIGKKIVMAVTGLVLVLFVIGHMAGNLQIFMGSGALNAYSEFLHHMLHGAGLWIARIVLLASVLLHIWAAVGLTRMNAAARPVAYKQVSHQASTIASRYMRVTGFVLLFFIVFHLLNLTTGQWHPGGAFVKGEVYRNLVSTFQVKWVSALYIVAMIALAGHLSHGIWSLMQTLGWNHPRYNALRKQLAWAAALVVVIANISFPIAVLAGFVR
ncbi:MAG TPA: succinate dehydrogenase cytochrome b subunit [Holophagaceae bacterium]|nr:succinate dehydrogenase cytochrome b subunit [Holophagaceae bacterium]